MAQSNRILLLPTLEQTWHHPRATKEVGRRQGVIPIEEQSRYVVAEGKKD